MKILRMPDVLAETGHRSHASIYNAIRDGCFTKPVRIGSRSVGWPLDEVEAINAALIAGKTKAEVQALVHGLQCKRLKVAD